MSQVVVGLGNLGPEYHGTRHNIGHRVVDVLAARLRQPWCEDDQSLVARGERLTLVKPQAFMNAAGPMVAAALRKLDAEPAAMILVYDDIDMALGKVRIRMKGRAGGHNGVKSIIATLGTDEIRRVKVGIGRPAHKEAIPDHVLTTFDAEETPIVDAAVELAADRVLELIERST